MRKILSTSVLTAIIIFASVVPQTARAQFHWGPRVGFNATTMHFNKDLFDSDNRMGFTGGLTMEVGIPMTGLCLEASLLYVHAKTRVTVENDKASRIATPDINGNGSNQLSSSRLRNRDYFSIPVNLKYKLQIPGVSKIICPYVFTGPDFAFLASKKRIGNAFENKGIDVSWDFGFGLQFISKLQIGASYSIGMTKAVESLSNIDGHKIEGRNRFWTVTATWFL